MTARYLRRAIGSGLTSAAPPLWCAAGPALRMSSPSRHPRFALALLVLLAPALAASPAHAASCPARPALERPFTQFGDGASYYLAPAGSFESTPWPGGSIVAGNESFFVRRGGGRDRRSLDVAPGGATSPATCVGLTDPTIRLFAMRTAGSPAQMLRVAVRFTGRDGRPHTFPMAPIGAGANGAWVVSPPIPILVNATPLPRPDGTDPVFGLPTASVRFTFTPDPGSAWHVDDVYVDPYQRN
jgi:hypothetical protein